MNADTIISPVDGLKLSFIYAEPAAAPRGIVQIAHGMCEHKERYIPLMEFLCRNASCSSPICRLSSAGTVSPSYVTTTEGMALP